VAGIAVLLALLGGGGPGPDVAAGRATATATLPSPGTAARPFPGAVVAVPTLSSAVTTAVRTLGASTLGAASSAARVGRRPSATSASSGRTRSGAPAPTPTRTPRPTPTATRPSSPTPTVRPGVPTVLHLEPSTDRRYTASISAPPGWLVTSVRDVRGGRQVEHVGSPTRTFEGTLRPGPLVVEVTPQPGAGPGTLVTRFTDRSGALLPGSGTHPLP
jgi:hypothetical protein